MLLWLSVVNTDHGAVELTGMEERFVSLKDYLLMALLGLVSSYAGYLLVATLVDADVITFSATTQVRLAPVGKSFHVSVVSVVFTIGFDCTMVSEIIPSGDTFYL